jgi:hypothetical protein
MLYDDAAPAWSPDGSLIAFQTTRVNNTDIFVFEVTGANPVNLTLDGATPIDDHATRPSWSPDGNNIAFQARELDTADFNIWRVNKAGTVATQVTTGTDDDVDPAWSPDGSQIAFQRLGTGVDKTFVIAALGTGSGTQMGSSVTPVTNREVDWRPVLKVFDDVGGHIFVADIIWLANRGITKGCNPPANDLFCPNDSVTRGQMAAFLVRFLGLSAVDPGVSFDDTAGSIFEGDIVKLASAGITRGCNPPDNDRFCPGDIVTRGQMAAFLSRALSLTVVDPGVDFGDTAGSIFEGDIVKLASAGITRGCNPPANSMFCPGDVVTRGQMAAFLHRAEALLGP